MPYIDQERRAFLDRWAQPSQVAGELNYKFTQDIIDYVLVHGLSYQTCNDIVGALDNAKHEFRRRIQDPYEDRKIEENGDVYALILPAFKR